MEPGKSKSKPKSKTPPTKRKSKTAQLSEEQLLLTLQKKRECNARAQKIVETLLDPVPSEKIDYFLSSLVHINQLHYDDIVEERSIAKICGYSLCGAALSEIPKQQYIIAAKQNKVFDITGRKKFCSNKCYKASLYLREQLLTTPLWIRKEDDVIPDFKLLSIGGDDDKNKNKAKNKKENDEEIEKKNDHDQVNDK